MPNLRKRDGDQPLPKAGDVDVIEHSTSAVAAYASATGMVDMGVSIVIDLEKRAALGVVRYGKRLQTNNGRDARRDQYEELLDALNYGQQVLLENPVDGEALRCQEILLGLVFGARRRLEQA